MVKFVRWDETWQYIFSPCKKLNFTITNYSLSFWIEVETWMLMIFPILTNTIFEAVLSLNMNEASQGLWMILIQAHVEQIWTSYQQHQV